MRSIGVRWLCVCFLSAVSCGLLYGCGGGGPNVAPPGGGSVSDVVARLAGVYDVNLQQGSHYTVQVDGTTNGVSGSGATNTQPPVNYTYNGTISNTANLTLHVRE